MKKKPTEMTLDELSKTLTGGIAFHLNQGGKHGHTLIHHIFDHSGKKIGGKRTVTIRGRATVTYYLGDKDTPYETGERFLKAYQQQLRDEEFEASKPPEEKNAAGSK